MTTQIQRRRGTTAQHGTFTGANGEITIDTDKEVVVVHDGSQVGGYPAMRENGSNSALALGSAATPSLKFTGDTNTGLYSPGADQVAISTNGTGRLFVDASGNVGIGNSSQTSYNGSADNLVIGSSGSNGITIASSNTGAGYIMFADGTTGQQAYEGQITYDHTSNYLSFNTSAIERLRIDSSGRLGLGTSSPQKQLEVNGAVRLSSDASTLLELGRFSSAYGGAAISCLDSSFLRFQFAGTDRMTLTSGGSLGIGTTSPTDTLNISSAANQIGLDTGNQAVYGTLDIGHFANGAFIGTQAGSDGASNLLRFGTGGTERVRIDSSGRLLVGTSSSVGSASNLGANLQVNEGTGVAASLLRSTDDVNGANLVFRKTRSTTPTGVTVVQSGDTLGRLVWMGTDGTNPTDAATISAQVDGTPGTNDMPGRLVFSTTADGASSPTERVRISADGHVSINTTSKFDGTYEQSIYVNDGGGTIYRISSAGPQYPVGFQNSSGTFVGSISSTSTATAYNTSSDYRLKENVVPLTGAIDRVNDLQVHRFNFIADPDKTVDGFIAHEAQAVVPECVTGIKDEVDDDGNPIYQGIDQSKLVPLLTAALQEAIGRIETLEAEVTALKAP